MSMDDERKRYKIHKEFIGYCENNDMDKIKETLLNHKIAMQTPPPHNYSFAHPICVAASYGHLDLVKYFLNYCKEINEPYDLEKYIVYVIYDAWHFRQHINIMFYMISIYEEYTGKHLHMNKIAYTRSGHPLNDCNIFTMIFWTVLNYRPKNINMDDMNKFLLYIYNQAQSVNISVDFNYMIDVKNINNIFTSACEMGNLELVKFMIENTSGKNIKKIRIHSKGEDGFGHACMSGNLELVKYLINIPINYSSRKIRINAIFDERDGNYTPFSIAIKKGHLHIAKYLEEITEGYYGKKLNIYKDTRIVSFAKSLPENMQIETLKWLLDLSKSYGKPFEFNCMQAINTPKLFKEYLQLYEHHSGLPYVITEKTIRGYMFDQYYDTLRYIMKKTKNIDHHITVNIKLDAIYQPCDLLKYHIKLPLYAAQFGWVNMRKGSMVQRYIKDEPTVTKYWYRKLII